MSRNIRGRVSRVVAAGAATLMLLGAGAAVASEASAATGKNGVLESGELGLYYLSNYRGPIFDLYVSDNDFGNDVFPGTSASANNNTESTWNRDVYTWYVYTGANRTGSRGSIAPGVYGNFNPTYKNTITSAYYYL